MLRIQDVYPGSFAHPGSRISDPVSRIPDLGSRIQKEKQKRGVKKSEKNSGGSHKYHKIENYFIFELVKKKMGQFTKNFRTFYPKNCQEALKNIGLGSGIRKRFFQKRSKRARIPDPDPQHWIFTIPIPCVRRTNSCKILSVWKRWRNSEPEFLNVKEPRSRFQGINSARLWINSLAP